MPETTLDSRSATVTSAHPDESVSAKSDLARPLLSGPPSPLSTESFPPFGTAPGTPSSSEPSPSTAPTHKASLPYKPLPSADIAPTGAPPPAGPRINPADPTREEPIHGTYLFVSNDAHLGWRVQLSTKPNRGGAGIVVSLGENDDAAGLAYDAIVQELTTGTNNLFKRTLRGYTMNYEHAAVHELLFNPTQDMPRVSKMQNLFFGKRADLDGLQLADYAEVKNCSFVKAKLRDSHLSHVKFINTKIVECEADSSNFSKSEFIGRCDCRGTDFRYGDLSFVDFGRTKLGGWLRLGGPFGKAANICGTLNQGIKIDALERAKKSDAVWYLKYSYFWSPNHLINWQMRNVLFDKFEDPATDAIAKKFSRSSKTHRDPSLEGQRGILELIDSEHLFTNTPTYNPRGLLVGHKIERVVNGNREFLYIGVNDDEEQEMKRALGRIRLVNEDGTLLTARKGKAKAPVLNGELIPAGAALYLAAEWVRGKDITTIYETVAKRAMDAYHSAAVYV